MPLPGNLTTILVTGEDYLAALGAGLSGYVALAPNVDLADPTAPAIIRTAPQQTSVVDGVMTPVTLACTDNTTLGPTGWAWTITEHLDGAPVRAWSFYLPSTAGTVVNGTRTVDLAALTPLATPPTLIQYLTPANNLADVTSEPTAFANIKQPATTSATGVVQLAGDLGGTATDPTVKSVQGVTISGTPAPGDVPTATGPTAATWQPASGGGSTTFSRQILIAADGVPSTVTPPTGTWTPNYLAVTDTGSVWSGWINESDGVQGSAISFDFAAAAGTYELELRHLLYISRGIYTVKIDGTAVGTIDGYAPAFTAGRSTLTGITIPTSGQHVVTLAMLTQNPSASGYYGLVERIALTRTD